MFFIVTLLFKMRHLLYYFDHFLQNIAMLL